MTSSVSGDQAMVDDISRLKMMTVSALVTRPVTGLRRNRAILAVRFPGVATAFSFGRLLAGPASGNVPDSGGVNVTATIL